MRKALFFLLVNLFIFDKSYACFSIPKKVKLSGSSFEKDYVQDSGGVENSIASIAATRSGANNKGDIVFYPYDSVTNPERMRIASNGNVGIGSSNPSQKLQVGSSGDGTVAIANSWTTFSDKRLKDHFSKISAACERIEKLNGYYYYWKNKEDQSRQIGVVAQEVELVFPEIVKTNEEGVKSVDYSKLSAVLIESNKELNSRLKHLEEENSLFKIRLAKLEKYFIKDR